MCDYTPIMKQYVKIKNNHRNKFLFFRMGDFYELFFNDAVKISKLLSLTLTSRGTYKGKSIPMAGFPYRSSHFYILKLIKLGKKIAICEQVGKFKKNGLIERKIVEFVTPGTYISDSYLKEDRNNYITCIFFKDNIYGLASLDLSTGHFFSSISLNKIDLLNELDRINPSEIIISNNMLYNSFLLKKFCVQTIKSNNFNYEKSYIRLKKFFSFNVFKNIDIISYKAAIIASGCLLNFVSSIKCNKLNNVINLDFIGVSDILYIDINSRKNLEIFSNLSGKEENSLFTTINFTITSMGKRLLRQWLSMPLLSRDILNNRLKIVSILKKNSVYIKFKDMLSKIGDLERILSQIISGSVKPIDLKRLQISLENFLKIKNELNKLKIDSILNIVYLNYNCLKSISDFIEKVIVDQPGLSIKDGNVIKPSFDPILNEYKDIIYNSDKYIQQYQQSECLKTGISNLKINYKNKIGYYIELSNKVKNIPSNYLKYQKLSNSTRYINDDLKNFETKILNTKNKLYLREKRIYNIIIYKIKKHCVLIQMVARYIAIFDVLQSFARYSDIYNWCEPNLVDNLKIKIKSGRHPMVENKKVGSFISNDIFLDNNNKILIITGANMGGKSTYMRQIAITVLLSHIGSHIPAESAEIGKIDKIFTRIGAGDDLANSCSTFMLEMNEIADILDKATNKSLVLIDEIGRGTNYLEGESLAWAILIEFIVNKKSFVLFSTHFHKLSYISSLYSEVKNIYFKVMEIDSNLVFFYKIYNGISDNSFGIHVAKMAGLSNNLIKNANIYLNNLKSNCFEDKYINVEKIRYIIKYMNKINPDLLSPKNALEKFYILKELIDKK